MQLLSLYHDTLLRRALTLSKLPPPPPSPHGRYTRFWTLKSALYRRVAYVLQIVSYVELLCEMAAKRRGEHTRWRVVVLLEAVKAVCRLLLLRVTRSRPLVTPVLPERVPVPEEPPADEEVDEEAEEMVREGGSWGVDGDGDGGGGGERANGSAHTSGPAPAPAPPHDGESVSSQKNASRQVGPNGEWTMPRTGMTLPPLPAPGDTSGYLLGRVLTADDIRPAAKLVNRLRGAARAAEVLHILAPLVFAVALARSRDKRRAWTPWLLGVGVELVARQLRDRGLRTTALERDEWGRRGWAMIWWIMRGAFYEHVTKGVVEGVRRRLPGLLAGIVEDYEYLWENYYFSTGP